MARTGDPYPLPLLPDPPDIYFLNFPRNPLFAMSGTYATVRASGGPREKYNVNIFQLFFGPLPTPPPRTPATPCYHWGRVPKFLPYVENFGKVQFVQNEIVWQGMHQNAPKLLTFIICMQKKGKCRRL